MWIKNKLQSREYIKQLNLNRVEETVFQAGQEKEVTSYLNKTNYKFYGIRDKSGGGGVFLYNVKKEDVVSKIQNYSVFSLSQSLTEFDRNNLLLQGDIQVNSDMWMIATLNDKKGISLRMATDNPKYNISINLLEEKDPRIRGISKVIDYIFKHELFDMVVEFTLYDKPTGVKQENIVIWELRNY